MLDHVVVPVSDYARSKRFYEAALGPLGYEPLMEFEGKSGGFGREGKPDFWIREGDRTAPVHVAFAGDRESVHAFYEAALGAGGSDNGEPGVRPHYHEHYYAAYVRDPDGNNVEVVSHRP